MFPVETPAKVNSSKAEFPSTEINKFPSAVKAAPVTTGVMFVEIKVEPPPGVTLHNEPPLVLLIR